MQDKVHTAASLGIGVDIKRAPRVFGRAAVAHSIYGKQHPEYRLRGSCPAADQPPPFSSDIWVNASRRA